MQINTGHFTKGFADLLQQLEYLEIIFPDRELVLVEKWTTTNSSLIDTHKSTKRVRAKKVS